MRIVVASVVLGLVGCAGAPSCKEAVGKAAKRFGADAREEVVKLIGTCEQDAWSATLRACFSAADTADKLQACLPLPDLAKALPPVEPSAATKRLVAGAGNDPVKALLFFAEDHPLEAVARRYFEHLGMPTEVHERLAEYELAARYKVYKDETIVLVRGERTEQITIDADLERAIEAGKVANFDAEVAVAVEKLVRLVPHAYLVAGHGEMTDADSRPPTLARGTIALTRRLQELDLRLAPLAPAQLAKDVPADATLVLWLGPLSEPSADEWAALARYADGGGHLLIALDPASPVGLGPLESKLGVRFVADHLADDKSFMPQHGIATDHGFVVTGQFGAHPTTKALMREVAPKLLLADAGRLERRPAAAGLQVTPIVQTLDSTFVDTNRNYTLDGDEQRGVYDVAIAVERGKLRAAVFADIDLFADTVVGAPGGARSVMLLAGALFPGTVRWVSGLEEPTPVQLNPVQQPSGALRDALHDLKHRRAVRELVRALTRGSER